MKIKLLVEGGEMKPGPNIAQQLGPIGINIGKVISDVNSATNNFRGMKVPIELDIDEKTKNFNIHISSPPTSELLKKEMALEKGSNKILEIKVGNASIEDIIKIAKIKHPNMLEKDLKSAVRSILGTCASIGLLVENSDPNELIKEINNGKFSEEIEKEITETSLEKRKELNKVFEKIKREQDAKIAAKAAEEAEKATESAKPAETTEKTPASEKTLEKKDTPAKKTK